jgi:hypothetical protein
MALANTSQKQVGGFKKGVSGNPRGRPAGSRNAATLACEALLEGQAEALTQKAVDMALAGDPVALRICLERICPVRKDRAVRFPLPPIGTPRDAADLMAAVIAAVGAGRVTPSEGAEVSKMMDAFVKAYQSAELVDRTVPINQMTDEELLRIIQNGSTENTTPRLLTINPD